MKGLYEIGVEIIAAPYQGPPIESLWWRAGKNPAQLQGDFFKTGRDLLRRFSPDNQVQMGDTVSAQQPDTDGTLSDRLIRKAAQTLIAPLWYRYLDQVLTEQPDIDAVIFLTIPLNHLVGVPRAISQKHDIPIFYYDGDVPASLPNMRGFASGFRIYQGADLSEYSAFISNSTGGAALLTELGAAAVHTVWYGADPEIYAPLPAAQQDIDVFFFGHGREYRGEWVDAMLTNPSQQLAERRFAVRGTRLGDLGATEKLPYLSFSKLREYVGRSKLNLAITRGAHASLYASSSMRPFELAAMGACIVANPYQGIEAWFEPEKEIIVVESPEEVVERYRYLLQHDAIRQAVGQAARARLLKQHTFRHRAQELLTILNAYC